MYTRLYMYVGLLLTCVHVQYVGTCTYALNQLSTKPSTHQVEIGDWEDGLEFLSQAAIHDTLQNEGYTLGGILTKQLDELLSVPLVW